ncbi:vacuolar protein sorting-associated protein VTA1 homolog isoform X8 [Neodiprion pinetum]|uniref:Vacuolar protein sorting-associated protein VTA1 homolog isoform X10 n=1 Tax=Neodiprion lecontei TaxID=441921 RepID=A0A6J0B365_NEOLC|nr:vacuolar protein sorting-associated protein VTA1 homolog isoform X10 [Neodiprion lecontei]XP_046476533.1 vacuolar protein sorting-associated protein VTA1 homolog isoform X10 [Neodiprion pinetum]
MPTLNLPECPTPLKSIQHFLKAATEHDQRDPVISYWCRLHALQTGLKLSTKTSEETGFLLKLMDWLEQTKKTQHENEAITNEVAAQAHLENYAHKLFMYADSNDRASNFGKNVIKAFYSSGVIYDVLTTFGELSEEAAQNRKYAKWRAAYIHNCLKNGETPVPGPMKGEGEENEDADADAASGPPGNIPSTSGLGGISQPGPPSGTDAFGFPSVPQSSAHNFPVPPSNPSQGNLPYPNLPGFNSTPMSPTPYNPTPAPTPTPTNVTPSQPSAEDYKITPTAEGGVSLDIEQMNKAQKYVKWAGSALNYDDVSTAVENLRKALQLLTTGQDPA